MNAFNRIRLVGGLIGADIDQGLDTTEAVAESLYAGLQGR